MNVATSRVIKLLKYLPRFGWRAEVVCPRSDIPHSDASRQALSQLSPEISVAPSGRDLFNDLVSRREADLFGRVASQIMNNIIPPDGHLYWALASLPHIRRLVDRDKPDIVLTTSNPYSLNLVGGWIRKKYHIPWVADFRDLWTLNQQPKRFLSAYHQGVSGYLENFFMKRCDRLVVTTKNSRHKMIARYPHLAGRVHNIPNGFDPEDVQPHAVGSLKPGSFLYTGSIVANTRYNPGLLLRLIAKVLKENNEGRHQFHYAGLDGDVFGELLDEARIRAEYIPHGYLSHQSLYDLISTTEYALMCLPAGMDCSSWVPSRFYDYIGNRKKIICLAPRGSEVVDLLEQYGNALCLYYDDPEEKKITLLKKFFAEQGREAIVTNDFLRRFSREDLAERMTKVFNEISEG